MKYIFFLFFFAWIVILTSIEAYCSSPYYYGVDKRNSIAVGYSNVHLNHGTFNVGFVELTHYTDPQVGWEYSTRVEYGKDYFSIEPAGLIGIPMLFITESMVHLSGIDLPWTRIFWGIVTISSAKLPITVDRNGMFEITPFWSLLKITKVNGKFLNPCGDLGLQFKYFPFVKKKNWASTMYISAFGQWNWEIARGHGYSFGAQLGMYLF